MNTEQDQTAFMIEYRTPHGWKGMSISVNEVGGIHGLARAGVKVVPGKDVHVIEPSNVNRLEGQSQ